MRKLLVATVMLGLGIGGASSQIRLYDKISFADADKCEKPGLPPDETISWCASFIRMRLFTTDKIRFAQYLLHMGLAYREKGLESDASKHFILARQVIGEQLASYPDNPEMLRERCWIGAVSNTDLDTARSDCERGLKSKPAESGLLASMGFVTYRQGRYREAFEAYEAALKAKPDDANALFMRGVVKQKLGDDSGAAADIKAAVSRDFLISSAYKRYGVTAN